MNIHMNAPLNMPVFTSKEDKQVATCEDAHLQKLKSYIIHGWPYKKDELENSIRHYWPFRSELAKIDGIAMGGK